jgi:hypothetical protein
VKYQSSNRYCNSIVTGIVTGYFPVLRLLTKFLSVQDNVAEIRKLTVAKNTTHFCNFLEVDKDIFKSFLSVPTTRSVSLDRMP